MFKIDLLPSRVMNCIILQFQVIFCLFSVKREPNSKILLHYMIHFQ